MGGRESRAGDSLVVFQFHLAPRDGASAQGAAGLHQRSDHRLRERRTCAKLSGRVSALSYEPAAISLSEKAFVTAWRELAAPSLRLTFERWNATVRSEICSAWPISEVVLPPAD